MSENIKRSFKIHLKGTLDLDSWDGWIELGEDCSMCFHDLEAIESFIKELKKVKKNLMWRNPEN